MHTSGHPSEDVSGRCCASDHPQSGGQGLSTGKLSHHTWCNAITIISRCSDNSDYNTVITIFCIIYHTVCLHSLFSSIHSSIHRTSLFHTRGTMPSRRSLTTHSAPLLMPVELKVDNKWEPFPDSIITLSYHRCCLEEDSNYDLIASISMINQTN